MVLLKRILFSHTTLFSSLVIISVILMTCLFDQPTLMLGEIGSVSLLGLEELKETEGLLCRLDTAQNVVPFNIYVPVLP